MQIFLAHITDIMTVFIMMVLSAQGLGGLKSRPGTIYYFVNFVLNKYSSVYQLGVLQINRSP